MAQYEYPVVVGGERYIVESEFPLTPEQVQQYAAAFAQQAAPQQEEPNLRAWSAQRAAAVPQETGPTRTPYQQSAEKYAAIRAEVERLKEARDQLRSLVNSNPTMYGPALADSLTEYDKAISELQKQLPFDFATAGGAAGNIIGGALGGLVRAPGIGAMVGGLAGTTVGGLIDAAKEQMTEREKRDYLANRAIEQVVLDTAGNILFFVGGKIVKMVKKTDPAYQETLKRWGAKIVPVHDTGLNAPAKDIFPGEPVFRYPAVPFEQQEKELLENAVEGGRILTTPSAPGVAPMTPTRGQLTGDIPLSEQIARVRAGGYFGKFRRSQENTLQTKIDDLINKVRGRSTGGFAGQDFREVLEESEDLMKRWLGPIIGRLGKNDTLVDITAAKRAAEELKAADEKASLKFLEGRLKTWVEKIASADDAVPISEAHEVNKTIGALVRDLSSTTEPDSNLLRVLSSTSAGLTDAIAKALPNSPELAARDMYREGMSVLYDPAFHSARRAAESAAGDRVIAKGEVEGLNALDRLAKFTAKLGGQTGNVELPQKAQAAMRGIKADFLQRYAGSPEAMARLPDKMTDPAFARTFTRAFPKAEERKAIETLSQAAQIIQRLGLRTGIGPGTEPAVAQAASAAASVGSPPGTTRVTGALARVMSWMIPRRLAVAVTMPEVRAELPRLARIMIGVANGTLVSSPELLRAALPESTRRALDIIESIPEGAEVPAE